MSMSTTSTIIVDLEAIAANLAAVRARVCDATAPRRQILAAVKANAYGHGAVAVATMIERTGSADWLGVATVPEGLELRAAGITLPILKLSVARGREVAQAIAAGITLPVADELSIAEAAQAAASLGRQACVHLKVDTGMRRIGCRPEDAVRLARLVGQGEGASATSPLRLTGIYSHLPVSDTPSQDDFTNAQITLFREVAEQVEAVSGPLLKHLANSAAVLAHPDAWLDMVRPGIMLYGAYPDPACPRTVAILPALEWKTQISFVKKIAAGDTVSYGRTWTAPCDTWIATVPVGYGDGYSRLLSSRGRVLIGGNQYPIVGRVCMDQFMVDLGPQTTARVGDEVVLIGNQGEAAITTTDIAELMGTIPYEVTCVITRRVLAEYLP